MGHLCFGFELVEDQGAEIVDRNAFLGHGVAVAHGDRVVNQGVVIDGDTHRGADGILTAVTLSDGVFLIVLAVEVEA